MSIVYLIGGSPRSGKTIIFNEVIKKKPMIAISSDALREAVRFTLLEEKFVTIQKLSFKGDATFHRSGEDKNISHTKHFSFDINQEELTWNNIKGLLSYYDRKGDIPLIIEGMAITPERVKSLSLENLEVRAVFLGFTDESYFETIFKYSNEKKDWIYKKINQEDGGDDSAVRKWLHEELNKNKKIAALTEEYGYKFFSPHENSFDNYRDEVVRYLLK